MEVNLFLNGIIMKCSKLLSIFICLSLQLGVSYASGPPMGETDVVVPVLADSDGDGVDDSIDLCPNTPLGEVVNAYGCPTTKTTCDYSTSVVTLNTTGGSSGTTITTRYILASSTGMILQVNTIPTFNGLSGTATYMAVAVTFEGAAANLSAGRALSAVSASCLDWSDALVIKVCVPTPSTCDYQIGQTVTLQAAGGSTGTTVQTRYVLTDSGGKLVEVAITPSFATNTLTAGSYSAYALTYINDSSIQNLLANGTNTIDMISANCLALSQPLVFTLCTCDPKCIPIKVDRLH